MMLLLLLLVSPYLILTLMDRWGSVSRSTEHTGSRRALPLFYFHLHRSFHQSGEMSAMWKGSHGVREAGVS